MPDGVHMVSWSDSQANERCIACERPLRAVQYNLDGVEVVGGYCGSCNLTTVWDVADVPAENR